MNFQGPRAGEPERGARPAGTGDFTDLLRRNGDRPLHAVTGAASGVPAPHAFTGAPQTEATFLLSSRRGGFPLQAEYLAAIATIVAD